jgi:hypothetical protein
MDIPFDLLNIVASYLVRPKMKLLDWIDMCYLNWDILSENPNAIDLLEKYPDRINWCRLSSNHNATNLLLKNPNKIDYNFLCDNNNILYILESLNLLESKDDLYTPNDWEHALYYLDTEQVINDLLRNPTISHKCFSKISKNVETSYLIYILQSVPRNQMNKLEWYWELEDMNAEHLQNILSEKILDLDEYGWSWISKIPHAIHLLEIILQYNPDKINWYNLSRNPNVNIVNGLLKNNIDKIIHGPSQFSKNPSIFEIDVKQYNIDVIKKAHNIDYN